MQLVNQLQKIVGYVEVFLAETLARCDRFYAVFGNIKNDLSLVICDEYSPGPALNDAIGRPYEILDIFATATTAKNNVSTKAWSLWGN